MSLHKSLKRKDALQRRRNVLTRAERVERLKEDERWEDEDSVFGLPKVKPRIVVAPVRAKVKEEEELEEGLEGEAAADAEAETEEAED
jgi:small basic protein (TIGR04137 family)